MESFLLSLFKLLHHVWLLQRRIWFRSGLLDICCKSVLEHLFYPLHVSSVLFDTHLSFNCSSCDMPSDTFVQVVGAIEESHIDSLSHDSDLLTVFMCILMHVQNQMLSDAELHRWDVCALRNDSFSGLFVISGSIVRILTLLSFLSGLEVAQSSLLLGGRRSAYFWRGKEVLWEQWSRPCYHYQ